MEKYKFFALYCATVFVALAALTMAVGRIVFGIYNYGYYYRSNVDTLFFVLIGIMAAAIAGGIFFAKKQCNENENSKIKTKSLILITGLLLAPALLIIVLMPVVIAI